jgi:hypothetical protein
MNTAFLSGNLNRRIHLGDIDTDGNIILKLSLNILYEGMDWIQLARNKVE